MNHTLSQDPGSVSWLSIPNWYVPKWHVNCFALPRSSWGMATAFDLERYAHVTTRRKIVATNDSRPASSQPPSLHTTAFSTAPNNLGDCRSDSRGCHFGSYSRASGRGCARFDADPHG